MKHYGKQRGVLNRACSGCGGDLGERYGKQRYCKNCHAANMRKNRPKHSELTPDQRLKANARSYAHTYLKRGKIIKRPCAVCGSGDAQMHHEDYSKPTDVVWLCRRCHLEHHKKPHAEGAGLNVNQNSK